MHCVGKTVTELHALLIDFEKGLKEKAPTPQVFTIQKSRDNKPKPQANKKVKGKGKADKNKQVVPYQPKSKPNPLKRKENPNKDQACHHCHVVGHWKRNCPFYLEEVRANKKESKSSVAVSGCGIHVCNTLQGFKEEGNYLMGFNICKLAHIGKTRMQKLHNEGLLENIDEESFDKCESCISGKMTKKPFNKNIERATDLLGLIHTDVCGPLRHMSRKGASYFLTFTDDFSPDKLQQRSVKCIIIGYPKETIGYYFYFPPENKVIVARYGDFLERDLISQKFSGRDYDLEDNHMDTLPSKNTSEIPVEPKSLGLPSELIHVHRKEIRISDSMTHKIEDNDLFHVTGIDVDWDIPDEVKKLRHLKGTTSLCATLCTPDIEKTVPYTIVELKQADEHVSLNNT
nr:retrotransposon protein, putative, Ty1-copia subclass [Tanacetum cinerariifolium]